MRSTLVRVLIVLCFFGTLIAPTAHAQSADPGDATPVEGPPSTSAVPQSTVNRIDVFFVKENGKTTIAQRVCGDGAYFQLRSEHVGQWITEIFNRTLVSGGCSPTAAGWYKMVINADAGPAVFRIYATNNDRYLSEGEFMERAARRDCHVTGYGTGYCDAPIVVSAPHADVNEPTDGQSVQGTIAMRGWAADLASLNGPGVNEVHVYAGDTFLGAANYNQSRSDVASVFGDARFTNSGYTYNLDTTRIPNGAATIRVAAKSTLTGQWNRFERRVTVSNGGTEPQPTPQPTLTRSRLYMDSRNQISLEFCGKDIHQNVYVGTKRVGRDFGTHAKRVDFGNTEQCAIDDGLVDGAVRSGVVYQTGVALQQQDVYNVCSSAGGLCDRIQTPFAIIVPTPAPNPSGKYDVPFFWQTNPQWKNKPFGTCSSPIGNVGCALTSSTMLLDYYGNQYNPATLADALGKNACLINWAAVASVSNGKVTFRGRPGFSWAALEHELNKAPVILELTNPQGGNHFVVVVSGSSDNPANYLVNDPALENGKNTRLSAVLGRRSYRPTGMRLYSGTPAVLAMRQTQTPFAQNSASTPSQFNNTEPITDAIALYSNTELTMTLHLTLQNAAPEDTEMLLSSDTLTNTTWQPFAEFVDVPLGEIFSVQFRNRNGDVSGIVSTEPVADIPAEQISLFLPLATR